MLQKLLQRLLGKQESAPNAQPPGETFESHIHEVYGQRLALGLTWTEVENASEAKRFAGKNHAYLTREIAGQLYVGVASQQTIGVVAAGALIGRVAPNAFIYQHLEGNRYWICMLRDGIPMPSYDRLVPEDEAQQIYTDATAYMAPGSEIIGNFAVAKITLEEVLANAAVLPKKEINECRLRKNGLNGKKICSSLLAASLVAVAGHLVIAHKDQLKSEERRLAMLRNMLLTQQQKAEQDKRIELLVKQFKERVSKAQQSFGQQGVAHVQFAQCEKVRKTLPLSLYGYKPEKLTCDFKASQARIEWMPINAQTRLSDRTRLPGVVQPLNTANPVLSHMAMATDALPTQAASFVDAAVVKMKILDWSQRNIKSMRFGADEAVVLTAEKEIKDLPGIQSVHLGHKTTLHINASVSQEILLLEHASQVLSQFPIAFESISWNGPVHPGAQFRGLATLFVRQ